MTVDAGALLQELLALIASDVERTRALVDKTGRALTQDEAQRAATYARVLHQIAHGREVVASKKYAGRTTEELLEMARGIPALREMLRDPD